MKSTCAHMDENGRDTIVFHGGGWGRSRRCLVCKERWILRKPTCDSSCEWLLWPQHKKGYEVLAEAGVGHVDKGNGLTNDKGDDKGNHLIDNLMTRVAQLEEKARSGHNTEVLNIASAAVAAADKIAGVAAQQRASVETVAADLSARLSAQVGDAFKTAVESGLVTHTDLIGTRLQAQFEDRLQTARETAQGLLALRQEMTKISKSLAADDVDVQEKKADEKQLPRVGSIFN